MHFPFYGATFTSSFLFRANRMIQWDKSYVLEYFTVPKHLKEVQNIDEFFIS
jgi:hypothetical protein